MYQNVPKLGKMHYLSGKHTKLPQHMPKDYKVFKTAMKNTENFHSKASQSIQNFDFFGMKIYHLATLVCSSGRFVFFREKCRHDITLT
jgi:hypothetical protein